MKYQSAVTSLKDSIVAIQEHRAKLIDNGQFDSLLEKKLSEAAKMACNAIDVLNELELKQMDKISKAFGAGSNTLKKQHTEAYPTHDRVYGDYPYVPHTSERSKKL